mgnify:CR=1 FL=1
MLVRDCAIEYGNGGDWASSAGTTAADCEWSVYGKDTWTSYDDHCGSNPCAGVVCPAGECEVASSCADGVCSAATAAGDGIACDDGDAATNSDVCTSGQCAGTAPPPSPGLFIAEIAEGSGANKYIEFYNPTDEAISLDGYAYPSTSNAPATPGEYESWNTFEAGATVGAGEVYIVCHGSADASLLAACDETFNSLSNGDDGFCLVQGTDCRFYTSDASDDLLCLDCGSRRYSVTKHTH